MTPTTPTPPPADVREDVRSTIAVALRWQQAEDEAYGPSLSVTKADAIIAALTEAGYAITKAEAGIVSIERREIEYDKGYDAFKQFVLEQIPDWEPGDWQVMAEAVWTAIDAATPAQAGVTLRYTDADMNAVYKAVQELALHLGKPSRWFFDAMDKALIDRTPGRAATPDPDEEEG